jgi:hypothetical protein
MQMMSFLMEKSLTARTVQSFLNLGVATEQATLCPDSLAQGQHLQVMRSVVNARIQVSEKSNLKSLPRIAAAGSVSHYKYQ